MRALLDGRRRTLGLGLVVATLAVGGSAFASCGGDATRAELPPLGEALLFVDTDAPVPHFVSRLRVDLYSADGATWYESRDIALVDERDWPASFSLYTPDESGAEHRVLVRLRAYPYDRVRDYEGERPVARAAGAAPDGPGFVAAPDGGAPRLLRDGVDATPSTEPAPFVTIDRLVLLELAHGRRGSVRVTLHGACFGAMADLAGLATCVDVEGAVTPVTEAALDADLSPPAQAAPKTFGGEVPCPPGVAPRPGSTSALGRPLRDEEICVPGGLYRFGSPVDTGVGEAGNAPERMALISPFLFDKYEVTVARWRDALSRGFDPPSPPTSNQGGMIHDTCEFLSKGPGAEHWCPYTHAGEYDDYALTCVTWESARAFCQFEGGDLPTEAQWEWVAMAYGRAEKTLYPWGDDISCRPATEFDRAVYARLSACQGAEQDRDECLLPSEGFPSCQDGLHFATSSGVPESCCKNQSTHPGVCCPDGDCCATAPDPELCKKCVQFPELTQCKKSAPRHVLNPRMGPQPVALLDTSAGDRSIGLGVVNLGGNAAEWTRDALRRLDSACWARAPLRDPACLDETQPTRAVRGGSWTAPARLMAGTFRHTMDTSWSVWDFGVPQVGFRCVRPAVAP